MRSPLVTKAGQRLSGYPLAQEAIAGGRWGCRCLPPLAEALPMPTGAVVLAKGPGQLTPRGAQVPRGQAPLKIHPFGGSPLWQAPEPSSHAQHRCSTCAPDSRPPMLSGWANSNFAGRKTLDLMVWWQFPRLELSSASPPPMKSDRPGQARQLDAGQVQDLIGGCQAGFTVYELGDRFGVERRTVSRTQRATTASGCGGVGSRRPPRPRSRGAPPSTDRTVDQAGCWGICRR